MGKTTNLNWCRISAINSMCLCILNWDCSRDWHHGPSRWRSSSPVTHEMRRWPTWKLGNLWRGKGHRAPANIIGSNYNYDTSWLFNCKFWNQLNISVVMSYFFIHFGYNSPGSLHLVLWTAIWNPYQNDDYFKDIMADTHKGFQTAVQTTKR